LELQQAFGANVRHHRRAKGWTQDQLGERVGVTLETIGKIERGVVPPSFDTAERIAKALGVAPLALFSNAMETLHKGERGKLLRAINVTLSRMNDTDLARAVKMLAVLSGS
jgi:transcriptional regulator with XRE-family HTH domain